MIAAIDRRAGEDRLQEWIVEGRRQHELDRVRHPAREISGVFGEPCCDAVEEGRGLSHDKGVAQFVLGAELAVQALSADTDRGGDRAHPDRRPTAGQDDVAGRVEREFAQSGPSEGPGFGPEVHDSHAAKSSADDISELNVEPS